MHEIEDRLQAPVSANLVALAKMFVGIVEAFIGGLLVFPVLAIFMGANLNFTLNPGRIIMLIPILITFASAALGLLVGMIVKLMQIAAIFLGFLMPMVFSGAIFFSWKGLSAIPIVQKFVLINPLVYANYNRTICKKDKRLCNKEVGLCILRPHFFISNRGHSRSAGVEDILLLCSKIF